MDFQQVYEKLPGRGWLTEDEARTLWEAAKKTKGDILEVGSYFGRSSVLLASLGRRVHCVDPFDGFDSDLSGDDVEKGFRENTKDYPNIVLYRQKVEDWETRDVGIVYLDGDHTYEGTKRQIEKALQCHPQIIACHDYCNDGGGREIVRATSELLNGPIEHVGRMSIFKL